MEARIGHQRARTSYAYGMLLEHGVRLALGTDWPVAPLNPLLTVYAAVTRATGVRIGKRQLEELARRAAAHVEAFYLSRVISPAPDDHPLVLTFDGKGIVMLPGALRPATAKAAASAQGKLATRLSPGEKNGRKRMAELACVYDAVPGPRTPEDIISTPAQKRRKKKAQARKAKGKGKPREPQARGKWLTASVTDDIPAVIAAAFDEAERRDPGHSREWAVLVDGNSTQIEAVTAEAAARGVTVTIVIDFIHVLEYLWKAAWSFFDKGEPASEEWVADQARKILHGKAHQVAAGIRRRATTYGYTGAERDGADACANYLTAKNPYLGYGTALAAGWPIATGVIEGACRHLVKDRFVFSSPRRVGFCPLWCQTVRAGYSWASYRLPRVQLSCGDESGVPGGAARRPGVLDCGR